MKIDRSRNEWRLMISLINYGYEYEEIEKLFLKYPGPGKYKEKLARNPGAANDYLIRTYTKAKAWVDANPGEGLLIAQTAADNFSKMNWPGISGGSSRAVMKAHIILALRCKKKVYSASFRELALLAQVTPKTAYKATHRLITIGLLNFEQKGYKELANKYSLGNMYTLSIIKDVRECLLNSTHEVFNHRGLGKSAEIIWDLLKEGPKTEKELVILSGKCLKTIRKWLNFMSRIIDYKTGEVISMVYKANNSWQINYGINLDRIAEVIGIAGTQERREKQFKEDRKYYKRGLKLMLNAGNNITSANPEQPDKQALEAPK